MQKNQGQEAVSRILEIRKYFPKASLTNKIDYAEDFKNTLRKLIEYLKSENNIAYVTQISKKLPSLQDELRSMKATITEQEQSERRKNQPVQKPSNNQTQNKYHHQENKEPQKNQSNKIEPQIIEPQKIEISGQIADAIVRQKPNVKWDDVAGLDQAKKVIQQAVILPLKFPEVFVGQRRPWKGILLYGPPGTGKTYIAKACASEQKNGTFFSVSASDIMSKYVGQAEKTLKALFQVARQEKPSIIFIDEIDSLAGERSSQENEVSRRVKTQFLIQMQGVGNDCTDVLVLGATNLPWSLDPAVRRRFQKRVYIPLPDIKGRLAMVKIAVQKNNIKMTTEQMHSLGQMLDGYSGSDIASLTNDALMSPVRTLDKVKLWVQVNDNGTIKYAPVKEGEEYDTTKKTFSGSMQDLKKNGQTIFLETKYSDFVSALKSSKPSVSQKDLGKYIQFTKTFGMDG